MRKKDPELMKAIVDFVDEYYESHGKSPSTRVIAAAVGSNRNSVQRYLIELNARKELKYNGRSIRTPRIEIIDGDTKAAGLIGNVSCGTPAFEEENVEAYIQLPTYIFGNGDLYILRAYGDSMINAGIGNGDYVVVRKTTEAREGDIVVALVENETTLKRFYYDFRRRQIRLHPENSHYGDIYVDSCDIQGVATHVIRALESDEPVCLR